MQRYEINRQDAKLQFPALEDVRLVLNEKTMQMQATSLKTI